MIKMRINKKSLSVKATKLLELSEQRVKEKLVGVAEDLTERTPVQTGAYAESFSVRLSTDLGGRSRSSAGRPKGQSLEEYRGVALANMTADIESLKLLDMQNTSVSFRNRAPHARAVEDLYAVFGAAKDINR